MSRTVFIVVSENQEHIEKAKKGTEGTGGSFQVYSPNQWREGLDNVFFRQQLLQGVPALSTGNHPVTNEYSANNVLPFAPVQSSANVQKMDDLEAKAIENAIVQYKGNLTEAAKALGIGRATLYRKVKQYQIDPSAARKRKVEAA